MCLRSDRPSREHLHTGVHCEQVSEYQFYIPKFEVLFLTEVVLSARNISLMKKPSSSTLLLLSRYYLLY